MNNSQVHTDVSLVHTAMHLNNHFSVVLDAALRGDRKAFLERLRSLRSYADSIQARGDLEPEPPVLTTNVLPWKEMREDGNGVDPLTGDMIVKRTYTMRELPMWVDASGPDGFAFALLLSRSTRNVRLFQSLPELVQEAREQGLLAFRDDEDCEAYIRSGLASLLRLGWVEQHLKAEGEDHYAFANTLREKAQAKLNERVRVRGT